VVCSKDYQTENKRHAVNGQQDLTGCTADSREKKWHSLGVNSQHAHVQFKSRTKKTVVNQIICAHLKE